MIFAKPSPKGERLKKVQCSWEKEEASKKPHNNGEGGERKYLFSLRDATLTKKKKGDRIWNVLNGGVERRKKKLYRKKEEMALTYYRDMSTSSLTNKARPCKRGKNEGLKSLGKGTGFIFLKKINGPVSRQDGIISKKWEIYRSMGGLCHTESSLFHCHG